MLELGQKDLSLIENILIKLRNETKFEVKNYKIWCFDEDNLNVEYEQKKYTLSILIFNELCANIINLFEDVLPVGSVVELKLNTNLQSDQKAYFIVVKRFQFIENCSVYIPYEFQPYPVGPIDDKKKFYGSNELIKEVIFTGYFDINDYLYVNLMRSELIFNKKSFSMNYAPKELRDKLQEQMEANNG